MKFLDKLLNRVTMYRLAIYYLASLIIFSAALSIFNILPFNPSHIFFSAAYLVLISWLANLLLAKVFKTQANTESAFITALILALIAGPQSLSDSLPTLTFLGVAAMASKYILAWRGKHLFNPAAAAAVISALVLNQAASWWVGSIWVAPLIILGGLVVIKKTNRGPLLLSFLLAYLVLTLIFWPQSFYDLSTALGFMWGLLVNTAILFFAFIMLTEPQTSPKRKAGRLVYGVFVAVMLVIFQTYLAVPYTLELALLVGNVFAFTISPSIRASLILRAQEQLAPNIYGFWFARQRHFNFIPGQFLEWTAYHAKADSRGIRRYFTIASSPAEKDLLLAAKIPGQASSFKKSLLSLRREDKISATGPEGDFVMPAEERAKLVFIAGGIGITPFRSMVRYLLDKNLSRDIVLLYSANTVEEFVFGDVFSEAQNRFAMRTVYAISEKRNVPEGWGGETGFIDTEMIKRQIPDWQDRIFYISGPEPMVRSMENILQGMGISGDRIKTDYFPGYEEI